jgi:NADH dehydrogenase FAD-containing subunit
VKIKQGLVKAFKNKNPIISVIGEGATGTEIVSEIATLAKTLKKNITLNHFLYFNGYFLDIPKYNILIQKRMKKLKVNVHLNEPVIECIDYEILTKKGKYNSDYIIISTGVKPNCIATDINTEMGCGVNSFNQVENQVDAYAIGDVALLPYRNAYAPNLGQVAERQAIYLSKYLIKKERNKKTKPFKFTLAIIISLGKHYAVARIADYITLSGRVIWILKRTYYFIQIFLLNKDYKLFKELLISMISKNKHFI